SAQVTVTVSPLVWRTLPLGGVPALVAVRQVQTPDGTLTQGFVLESAAWTTRLASKAGGMVAALQATDAAHGVEIVSGWRLTVAPDPHAVASAAAAASEIARSFVVRFVGIGALALVAAALVLVLVLRAEK